jgi:Tfp pilus assembly protein PilX
VALIVSLIMLVGVTVIAIAGVNQSSMELRMARNLASGAETFEIAEAAIDFMLNDPASTLPVSGSVLVPTDVPLPGTTDPGTVFYTASGSNNSITATATRLLDCAPPPRAVFGTSVTVYSAFVFEVSGDADRTGTGDGRTGISQGYVQLGPKC